MSDSTPQSPRPASDHPPLSASSGSQRIRVLAVELAVGESEALLPARSAQAIGIEPDRVLGLSIARRALDARRRGRRALLKFVYHVDLELPASFRSPALARALQAGRARAVPPPARFALVGVSSVSFMGPLFGNRLQSEVVARAMPSFISSVEIVRAELGEEVVVIGALCL